MVKSIAIKPLSHSSLFATMPLDIQAFSALASHLRCRLLTAATRWLADAPKGCDAPDDIVQDTLLRLWSIRDRLDSYTDPEALAMVMARRITIDALRRVGVRQATSLDDSYDVADSSLTPEEAVASDMEEEAIAGLIDALPSRQAMILKMRHADGLELDEIASVSGISEGNVRVLLSRGRSRLRQLYMTQLNEH
ncbi:MAG: sigma-70 family RNA polymerase sigma factor [Pseudoflavonifractor sp.]|nr:sigma-70 family RNA polymerase sigma factor [Alloprevotella sp.]MCM1117254.1 sigma-70 family RNA polymerase sigma factor [Pseudoflavonifractor sp.]